MLRTEHIQVSAPQDWTDIYDRFAGMEEDFLSFQLDGLQLQPHHSVLDVGAGSGRLALPMAHRVNSVTAIDIAPALLAALQRRAAAAGLDNVTTLAVDWEAIRPGRDLPRHDVVVASRFTGTEDLLKLDAAASARVCLILYSGPSPKALHGALLEGIAPQAADPRVEKPGFARIFNELCELGIEPHVTHVPDGFSRLYPSEDAALADFAWLGVKSSLQHNLRLNIRRFLQADDGGVRFLFRTRSTLIWWEK